MLGFAAVNDDFELLERWRGGDRQAGSTLLRRYFESLYGFFRGKTDGDVEDLIQRTFLACVEAKERVRDDGSFRGYLFTIARHELYRHFRKRQREPVEIGSMSLAQLGSSLGALAARRQEEQLLLAALRQIPLDLQIALELHYWEELTTSELATVLAIPAGTVKSRLRRAREALRHALTAMQRADPAASPAVAETLDNFDHWVRSVRSLLGRAASG